MNNKGKDDLKKKGEIVPIAEGKRIKREREENEIIKRIIAYAKKLDW